MMFSIALCIVAHAVCFSSYFQATAGSVVWALFQADKQLGKAGIAKQGLNLSHLEQAQAKRNKAKQTDFLAPVAYQLTN